jgi:hypothetical protein
VTANRREAIARRQGRDGFEIVAMKLRGNYWVSFATLSAQFTALQCHIWGGMDIVVSRLGLTAAIQ